MGRLASDKDPLLVLRRATGRHTIRQYLYGALTIVVLFFIYRWITNPPKQPFIDTQRTSNIRIEFVIYLFKSLA
ncbi:hypothetical protein L596_002096 [Steinernema carpocapsae]|uniref:Uncharacterized protein n=1 Tax=Steinernema carpocapsae TaxID=34508 RepID=A0A4U8UNH1_STECR|nr:hypothetical protein L596_002096 [Steinernema carpocapsae]